jgi:hypothetical protein
MTMKTALEKIKAISREEGMAWSLSINPAWNTIFELATEALEKAKYTVEVEIPELYNDCCSLFCPARQTLISGRGDCLAGYMKDSNKPGPNCPRYKS